MSNRKARVIVIIVIAVGIFQLICAAGFLLLNRYLDNVQQEALRSEVEEYMMQDQEFESQYGQVLSVTFDQAYRKNETYQYNLPCIVKTEDGNIYYVWVFLDSNAWTKITYKSISENKPDNWDEKLAEKRR
ncbi:MAG: hypothetical protein IJW70_01280 [Clostridia bacterium]|nr:hypothetical protein [Clostridia bacterium]